MTSSDGQTKPDRQMDMHMYKNQKLRGHESTALSGWINNLILVQNCKILLFCPPEEAVLTSYTSGLWVAILIIRNVSQ